MFISCLSKILLSAVSCCAALLGACWPLIMYVMCCDTRSSTSINLALEGILALALRALRRSNTAGKGKTQSRKLPLHVPQPSLLARHDNTVRPSFFFLDTVRERHLFYYQQRKRSPPSQRLVFLWRWLKAEGKTEWRKRRRESSGKIWSTVCWGRCYQRQDSFSGPEQNISRCFKEFDLQLKLLLWFLHYFIQRCFFLRGKVKGVGR